VTPINDPPVFMTHNVIGKGTYGVIYRVQMNDKHLQPSAWAHVSKKELACKVVTCNRDNAADVRRE
jgi:hypothetical protein